MKCSCTIKLALLPLILLLTVHAYADTTFIKFGATWKYLDNGSDPGPSWIESSSPGTDGWASGPAKFGYGNSDERTQMNYGINTANKYITTYFRTSINIPNTAKFSFFKLKAFVDDGMVVYVNGREICRTNMGGGVVRNNTFASHEASQNGNTIIPFDIPLSSFINGTNTIAVEVHQSSRGGDDLTFDLQLSGITKAASTEILRGPLLQMVSGEAITITWKTNVQTSSRILYGTSENALTSSIIADSLTHEHEMRITGLKPDTKYYYSVGTGNDILEGSYRNYFITSPPANTTRKIRIAVFGDAGTGNVYQKAGRDNYLRFLKKNNNSELALFLGDNAYNTGTDHEYQTNFFDIYDNNVFNNHVVFPIPGNHEYATPDVPYFSVFSLPTAGESGGLPSGTESFYSFNYGNIHFIMLNSQGSDNNTYLRDSTGTQGVWLKKDLEANAGTHKWTIVCLHHPPYTNGTHNSDAEGELIAIRQQITPILERYGVDAVLAGHSHVYERSFLIQDHTGKSASFKADPPPSGNLVSGSSGRYDGTVNSCPYFTIDTVAKKGTVYVVAGSAGQIGGGTNADRPLFYYKNYSGTSGGESGILYLEVQDNRLDAKFIGVSGVVRDQFTIMKGVNTKKTIVAEVNKSVDLTASWIGSYNWIPVPAAGKNGKKTLSFEPDHADTYIYYVKDSVGLSKTCISDTFEVKASKPSTAATLKFDARQKYNTVLLQWSTENEPDISYFTVERSTNGTDYSILTIVKTNANSVANSASLSAMPVIKNAAYEFEDNYPIRGKGYYRLKKTTKTGQTTIQGVRLIDFEALKSFTYSIKSGAMSKNLLSLNVVSAKKQVLQVNMFDMTGKLVYKNDFSASAGDNSLKIIVTPGMYVLNIVSPDNYHVSDKIILK
jgi:hypothetical protein